MFVDGTGRPAGTDILTAPRYIGNWRGPLQQAQTDFTVFESTNTDGSGVFTIRGNGQDFPTREQALARAEELNPWYKDPESGGLLSGTGNPVPPPTSTPTPSSPPSGSASPPHSIITPVPKPSAANATTLYEYYMACLGSQTPPLSNRGAMYEAFGLGKASGYVGSSSQNGELLESLKNQGVCPATAEEIFKNQTYTVTFVSQGQGRIVDPSDQLITQNKYVGGSIISLKAKAYPGHVFSHWSGDLQGAKISGKITVKSNLSVIAVFVPTDMANVIQFANLTVWEIRQLGRMVAELADSERKGGKSEEQLHLLDVLENLGTRIETDDSWYNYNFATGVTKQDSIETVAENMLLNIALPNLCTPLYLIGLIAGVACDIFDTAAGVANFVGKAVGEKMESGDLGTVIYHLPGEGEVSVDYGKAAGQLNIRVDVFDSSPGRILAFLPVVYKDIDALKGDQHLEPQLYAAEVVFPAVDVTKIQVQSPVELRVVDDGDRITGMVNGEIKRQIPGSSYADETVTIISNRQSPDSITHPVSSAFDVIVVGESDGEYGISISRDLGLGTEVLEIPSIEIVAESVHKYELKAPSSESPKEQIIMRIDRDGNGTFDEERIYSLDSLDSPDSPGFLESIQAGGRPPWFWVVIAAFVAAAVVVVVGVSIVRN